MGFGAAALQAEQSVESIDLEKIAVSPAGRAGAAIAELAEVVFPMVGPIFEIGIGGDAGWKIGNVGRNVEQHPVHPGAYRGVWVITDQGEA